MGFTHITEDGNIKMVDVSGKNILHRTAEAIGRIVLQKETVRLVKQKLMKKGDVLTAAKVAGITGAKKTSDLIPLCHNLGLNNIEIFFEILEDGIEIKSRVICDGKTGVEMEALTAVSIAALTVYDMCKAVDKKMSIENIRLESKKKENI